MNIHCVV